MSKSLFVFRLSNGILDFANMAVCSGLLVSTYDAIPEVTNETQNICSVTYKDSGGDSGSGPRIIAFVSSDGGEDNNTNDDLSLVDSGYASFPMFVFLNTEVNPLVSIRKAAVELFASIYDQLSLLKDQVLSFSLFAFRSRIVNSAKYTIFIIRLSVLNCFLCASSVYNTLVDVTFFS